MKISKLATLLPAKVQEFISIPAGKVTTYEELVQVFETQIRDPVTGLAKGEKTPGINANNPTDNQLTDSDLIRQLAEGYDGSNEAAEIIVNPSGARQTRKRTLAICTLRLRHYIAYVAYLHQLRHYITYVV